MKSCIYYNVINFDSKDIIVYSSFMQGKKYFWKFS